MKKQSFCTFNLAGVSLTEYGLTIPSPFTNLELTNSEISTMTSWVLTCNVGGDDTRQINIAAFEALLYGAAQASNAYPESSGIPISFLFGWLDDNGNVAEYLSYQGFTLKFQVSTSGKYMTYQLQGFASLSVQTSIPSLRIPEVSGFVQPSAVLEGLAKAVKADYYYQLDIDHNDAPTLLNHSAMTTSFNKYVMGDYSVEDDFDSFPGLLTLSKSYNSSRDAAGLKPGYSKLSQVLNNVSVSNVADFLQKNNTDTTPQATSFSYWVDEPTMTQPGIIHYKSNAGLMSSQSENVLKYGTSDTNILSLNGKYDGVAYNLSNMKFSQLGFSIDGSGHTVVQDTEVVNSWSSSLTDVFNSANIINDINAIATQFSGDFTVQIPGSVRQYQIAQPVSLLVVSGNTISPVTGVYNIISVSHSISAQFITTLKLQRLVMSTANEVATNQGILIRNSGDYPYSSYTTTSNIISPYKVEFPDIYPDFTYMTTLVQ